MLIMGTYGTEGVDVPDFDGAVKAARSQKAGVFGVKLTVKYRLYVTLKRIYETQLGFMYHIHSALQ